MISTVFGYRKHHDAVILLLLVILMEISSHFVSSTIFLYENATKADMNITSTTIPKETYEIVNGNLYKVEEDSANLASRSYSNTKTPRISSAVSVVSASLDRQRQIWEKVNSFHNYKTNSIYNEQGTLTKFKYVVLPIWWSDESQSNAMDLNQIETEFLSNNQYYKDMSWNKVDVTFEILTQTVFPISKTNPGFGETAEAARLIVSNLGKVQGTDYDGICLFYTAADSGAFSGYGGWASVNGDFMWNTYPANINVLRHEIGHNFGHPHHRSNSFTYRDTRPDMSEGVAPYDGWDMMSGGNNVDNNKAPHVAAASKWFYNWIPDSSIVHMQPEGSTTDCPSCVSSGTFTLRPFDDKNLIPDETTKMGIHIPITTIGNTVYSYWLSYRGAGYDGEAAQGLSVHLSWFSLGGIFGSSYDSLNYDAFGDTYFSTDDSFVVNGSCYYIFPSSFMKDRDLTSVLQVQPVVCVDSIDVRSSITVSVHFVNDSSPTSTKTPFTKTTLTCSESGENITLNINPNEFSMIHVQNTGRDGLVSLSMCGSGAIFSSYFYDLFPLSLLEYESYAAYGSYKSLLTEEDCGTLEQLQNVTISSGWRLWAHKSHTVSGWAWDIKEIKFYSSSTCSGTPITNDGVAFDSGNAGSGWGPTNAFQSSGVWGGRRDSSDEFYIGMSFATMKEVRCVHMTNYGDKPATEVRVQAYDEVNDIWVDAITKTSGLKLLSGETNKITYSLQSVIDYKSDYGEAYIVIPPSSASTLSDPTASIEVSCAFSQCLQNSYMLNQVCVQCPNNGISPVGSTSLSDCIPCPSGTFLDNPLSQSCTISEEYRSVSPSKGWRLWAHKSHTVSGWAWDIKQIKFYSTSDCTGTPLANDGVAFDSGNAGSGWGPTNAFQSAGTWGGRPDDFNIFYIGMNFSTIKEIQCLEYINIGDKPANEIRVQAYDEDADTWVNIMIAKDLKVLTGESNIIPLQVLTSASPTSLPSLSVSPSSMPSKPVTSSPSGVPTIAPSNQPSSEAPTSSQRPSLNPSTSPTSRPTLIPSLQPTKVHSTSPSSDPSSSPTTAPTPSPTTAKPTFAPTPSSWKLCRTANANKKINNCLKISGCTWCASCSVASGKCRPKTSAPTMSPSRNPTAAPSDHPSVSAIAKIATTMKVELNVNCVLNQSDSSGLLSLEVSNLFEQEGVNVQASVSFLNIEPCSDSRLLQSSTTQAIIDIIIVVRDESLQDIYDNTFILGQLNSFTSDTFTVVHVEFMEHPSAAPSPSPSLKPTPLSNTPTKTPTIAPTPSAYKLCRTTNAMKKFKNCVKITGCTWINNSCYHIGTVRDVITPISSPVSSPVQIPVAPPVNTCSQIKNKNLCKAKATCNWKNNICISK